MKYLALVGITAAVVLVCSDEQYRRCNEAVAALRIAATRLDEGVPAADVAAYLRYEVDRSSARDSELEER